MVCTRGWQSNKLSLSNSSGNIGAVCWNVSPKTTWVKVFLGTQSKMRGYLGVAE